MSSQPSARGARRASLAGVEPDERRGWLSHGLAALAISALGLAVAGSVALTTNAETTTTGTSATERTASTTSKGTSTNKSPKTAVKSQANLQAFSRRTAGTGAESRSTVRAAVVKERAAQRAEELSKTAEEVTRAAHKKGTEARSEELSKAEKATQAAAAKLAQERMRRAVAARVAAEVARKKAETETTTTSTTSSSSTDTSSSTPTNVTSKIPTGGGGVSPVPGAVIGAHFGQYGLWSRYHTGLDFRAAYGTPIRAVKAGLVLYAGNSGDWAGNHVAIRHGDGMTSMSSHMSSMAVSAGQTVQAGQVIGYVGQTGRAFGAHLHFELYPAGTKYGDVYRAINPQPWLAANGVHTR